MIWSVLGLSTEFQAGFMEAVFCAMDPNGLPSIAGHFGLFGFEQTYLDAVDANLRELPNS